MVETEYEIPARDLDNIAGRMEIARQATELTDREEPSVPEE